MLADDTIRSDIRSALPANGELILADGELSLRGSRRLTRAIEDATPGIGWRVDVHPEPDPLSLHRRLVALHSQTGLWPLFTDEESMGEAGSRFRHSGISECPLDSIRGLFGIDGRSDYEVQEEDYCFVCGPLADPTGSLSIAGERSDLETLAELLDGGSDVGFARYSLPHSNPIVLVPAERPADSISRIGWIGASNQGWGAGDVAIVLRSWEERFGAYPVAASRSTLELIVTRPPIDLASARLVARELLHFCRYDTQFHGLGGIEPYAQSLVRSHQWKFWWD